jgi:hypothetical protein
MNCNYVLSKLLKKIRLIGNICKTEDLIYPIPLLRTIPHFEKNIDNLTFRLKKS